MGQSKLFLQIFAAKLHNYLADTRLNLWRRTQWRGKERFVPQFDNRCYCLMQSNASIYKS